MIASAHLGRVPVPVRSAAATLVEALVSPEMLHGECVSIGCVWEAELAVRMGHLEAPGWGDSCRSSDRSQWVLGTRRPRLTYQSDTESDSDSV